MAFRPTNLSQQAPHVMCVWGGGETYGELGAVSGGAGTIGPFPKSYHTWCASGVSGEPVGVPLLPAHPVMTPLDFCFGVLLQSNEKRRLARAMRFQSVVPSCRQRSTEMGGKRRVEVTVGEVLQCS